MSKKTLYEEAEDAPMRRLTNALRTSEIVNAPDWVTDLAACLALAVTLPEQHEIPRPGKVDFRFSEKIMLQ